MTAELRPSLEEHAEDVLGSLAGWQGSGLRCALVILSATVGGAVRAPGALLAVREDGASAGYLSGGCIDADVILQAQRALETGKAVTLRYGAGSPFVDLPLPCGGALVLRLIPDPDQEVVGALRTTLTGRRPVSLTLDDDNRLGLAPPARTRPAEDGAFSALLTPRPRLRLAGRGADCLALARLADAAGWPVRLQLPDGDDVTAAKALGFDDLDTLETPSALPQSEDDPYTAFVLMFHDTDWETPLLMQALDGQAFYIGAVGSRHTHARRCERLRDAGLDETRIGRVRGPVGLVPSMRDASMLAVSVLAEIVESFHLPARDPLGRTGVLLLAAGGGTRFEDGDKLMVDLDGAPVLAHAAATVGALAVGRRIAVVDAARPERGSLLRGAGWELAENPDPAAGQASSLRIGLDALKHEIETGELDSILILLGDMPDVPPAHLTALATALLPGVDAVMSESRGIPCPPAIFSAATLDQLMSCTGDRGARQIFEQLESRRTVALSPDQAIDIDRLSDLEQIRTLHNA